MLIAPDPLDPLIRYAGDYQGTVTRHDKRSDQLLNITVHPVLSDETGVAGTHRERRIGTRSRRKD